ncbi:uncharacterized protein LOC115215450, partial [Argonauta hians]
QQQQNTDANIGIENNTINSSSTSTTFTTSTKVFDRSGPRSNDSMDSSIFPIHTSLKEFPLLPLPLPLSLHKLNPPTPLLSTTVANAKEKTSVSANNANTIATITATTTATTTATATAITTTTARKNKSFSDATLRLESLSVESVKEKIRCSEADRVQEGVVAKLRVSSERIEERRKRTIIYKCISSKSRKVERISKSGAEEILRPMWGDVTFANYCRPYGHVSVEFRSVEAAQKNSRTTLKNDQYMLVPFYEGKRVIRVVVRGVDPGVDLSSLTGCLVGEDLDSLYEVKATTSVNWYGRDLEVLLHAKPDTMAKIPHIIEVEDPIHGTQLLNVVVEGRRQICHRCKSVGHLRSSCPQLNATPSVPLLPKPQPEAQPEPTVVGNEGPALAPTQKHSAVPVVTAEDGGDHWTLVTVKGKKRKVSPPSPIKDSVPKPSQGKPKTHTHTTQQQNTTQSTQNIQTQHTPTPSQNTNTPTPHTDTPTPHTPTQ